MDQIAKNRIDILNYALKEFRLKPNAVLVSNGSNFVKADLDETFYIRLYFKKENDYHGFVELRSTMPNASLIRRSIYSNKGELTHVLELLLCYYMAEKKQFKSGQEREQKIKSLKKERDELKRRKCEYEQVIEKLCLDQKDDFRDLLIDLYPNWEVRNLTFELGDQTICLFKRKDGYRVSDANNMKGDFKDFECFDQAIEFVKEKMIEKESIKIIL